MDQGGTVIQAYVALIDTLACDGAAGPDGPGLALADGVAAQVQTILSVDGVEIVAADPDGRLDCICASSTALRELAQEQIGFNTGPDIAAHRTGRPLDLDHSSPQPPSLAVFAARASALGYCCSHTVPIRRRAEQLGAVTLLRRRPSTVAEAATADMLAGAIATGLYHRWALGHATQLNRQLQTALTTRLRVEQAKGILAERGSVTVERAFELLRAHARSTNQRLTDLAGAVIDGACTAALLDRAECPDRGTGREPAPRVSTASHARQAGTRSRI